MNITTEIRETELALRDLAGDEVYEHQRHRMKMLKIRAAREAFQARLGWLDELKKQGLKEIA